MDIENATPAFTGDSTGHEFGHFLHAETRPVHYRRRLRWTSLPGMLILAVCVWSLGETWIEIQTASRVEVWAVATGKLLWLGCGVLAISGNRMGRYLFAFLCGVSLLAVGSALPFLFAVSKSLFSLLLAECALKGACLIVLIFYRRW